MKPPVSQRLVSVETVDMGVSSTASDSLSTSEDADAGQDAFLHDASSQDVDAGSDDDSAYCSLTPSKSARRRMRRRRQRDAIRSAVGTVFPEVGWSETEMFGSAEERFVVSPTAREKTVVTLSDLGLDLCIPVAKNSETAHAKLRPTPTVLLDCSMHNSHPPSPTHPHLLRSPTQDGTKHVRSIPQSLDNVGPFAPCESWPSMQSPCHAQAMSPCWAHSPGGLGIVSTSPSGYAGPRQIAEASCRSPTKPKPPSTLREFMHASSMDPVFHLPCSMGSPVVRHPSALMEVTCIPSCPPSPSKVKAVPAECRPRTPSDADTFRMLFGGGSPQNCIDLTARLEAAAPERYED